MNVTDKYPLLIGHSPAGRTELHSMQEVADFICTQPQTEGRYAVQYSFLYEQPASRQRKYGRRN